MTRDYNKQQRDNVRPFSRNQSTNRYRDEQPSRPARPRLNRETVDRAWEAGAATQHADYRPRRSNTINGQPQRDNRRYNQSSEHSPAPYGRKPFGNQTDPNRRLGRAPDNSGFRSRSFNSDRGRFADQRNNENRQYDGPYRGANRPVVRDNPYPQANERRPQNRDNGQNRGYQRRNAEGYDRQPREFGRDGRGPRNFERDGRAGSKPPVRDAQNPRWQSRPAAQRGDSASRRSQPEGLVPQNAQFEGDYERFSTPENTQQRKHGFERPLPARKNPEYSKPQAEERHVTRLPDGRVLKGPRPAQRRNAQFWTGVAQETENLLEPVATTSHDTEATTAAQVIEQAADTPLQALPAPESFAVEAGQLEPKTPRKPRTRAASPIPRKKKTDAAVGSATAKKKTDAAASPTARKKKKTDSAAKPRSTGPKPSQRGHKWPTP